ncbi:MULTISPECIES: SRPBCC domain-containing protein [Nocardia]|uniref:SRPBCC domain-containing protein n=1 Tax=Nocardia TaxID=1817 RepID=UPI000BF231A7|nr:MULTISPECIES: SRPBCC domain-containing protein [Nocardia]MBF6185274.1 SRPBCC domain-containing protein [Nocardia farcinica]MBF6311111.1 SRPBCC domain-containing protein [Nocardia farcinica]MBF6407730.1 SRPBCC domain-containing protein [Nocardia farcinica]PEH77094.1 polyketide cyclase [Nocardia sp. FDAARGOS_372]UEX21593.1 SRPBCC domain-containing protein [Nocardia farcinica]
MAFVIDSTVYIDAPAATVWEVLTDFDSYGQWNPFVLECATSLVPGEPIDMVVDLGGGKPKRQREYMRSHTPGREFSYTMKPIPLGTLRSLRSHTVTEVSPERTRYESHFELGGWLHPVVAAALGARLRHGFEGMTAAVQRQAETLRAR